jgi:hypothetical protein
MEADKKSTTVVVAWRLSSRHHIAAGVDEEVDEVVDASGT